VRGREGKSRTACRIGLRFTVVGLAPVPGTSTLRRLQQASQPDLSQHLSPHSGWRFLLMHREKTINTRTHQSTPDRHAHRIKDSLTPSTRHTTRVSEHVDFPGARDHRPRTARSPRSFDAQPATQTEERLGRRCQDCAQAETQQNLTGRVHRTRREPGRWILERNTRNEWSRAYWSRKFEEAERSI
jgi:hypothetical protein